MTMIGADSSFGPSQSQSSLSKLKVGAEIDVRIKGLTRHGLIVQKGSSSFLLKTMADLPEAKSLTLKVTERTNGTNHQVQILAYDRRKFVAPVQGELTLKQPASAIHPASTTRSHRHEVVVDARPVSREGQYLGPTVTLRLATASPSAVAATRVQGDQSSGDAGSTNAPRASPATKPAMVPPSSKFGHPFVPSPSSQSVTSQDLTTSSTYNPAPASSSNIQAGAVTSQQERIRAQLGAVQPTATSSSSTSPAQASVKSPDAKRPSRSSSVPSTSTNPPSAIALSSLWRGANGEQKNSIEATVVGRSQHDGRLLLQIADYVLIKIEQPLDLPIGAKMDATMITGLASSAQSGNVGSSIDRSSLLTRLVELLEEIDQSGRMSAEHREPAKVWPLPMPDRDLAARLLHLVGLERGPRVGESGTSSLDHAIADVSKTQRLQNLLIDIANTAGEPLADGWRSIALPLGADPTHALTIHYRDHHQDQSADDDQPEERSASAQRALFDITFSSLGRCQIDTLCQEQRFDLLLRSERPLDRNDRQIIANLFVSASEIDGFAGEIGYLHGQFIELTPSPRSSKAVTT